MIVVMVENQGRRRNVPVIIVRVEKKEGRERDRKRQRVVLTIGRRRTHMTRDEAVHVAYQLLEAALPLEDEE